MAQLRKNMNHINMSWAKCCFCCKFRGYNDKFQMACTKHAIHTQSQFVCDDFGKTPSFPLDFIFKNINPTKIIEEVED